MLRKHIHLLFVCWLAYAVVPVINYIGVFNGVYVMLCATKGVMIHDSATLFPTTQTLDHSNHHAHHSVHQQADHHAHHMSAEQVTLTDLSAEDHEAERCPCIHYSFDTALFLATDSKFEKALQPIIDTVHFAPITVIYSPQARGPPTFHRSFHLLEQFT